MLRSFHADFQSHNKQIYGHCPNSDKGLVASFTPCAHGPKIFKPSFELLGNITKEIIRCHLILTKSLHTQCSDSHGGSG